MKNAPEFVNKDIVIPKIQTFHFENDYGYYCKLFKIDTKRNEDGEWVFAVYQEGQTNCVEKINLTRLVFERELSFIKRWHKDGKDIPLSMFANYTLNQLNDMIK